MNQIINKDCIVGLKELPDNSIDCCVTSPPYFGLRDYGNEGQIGLEETPEKYVQKLIEIFTEVKRVLKKEGTLWLNLGDSYNGGGGGNRNGLDNTTWSNAANERKRSEKIGTEKLREKSKSCKPKDLLGIPWLVAFALRNSGWYLRCDIIWAKAISGEVNKGTTMPESTQDRPTKSHEYIFLLSKSGKYYYDIDAIREPYLTSDEPPRSEEFNGIRNKAQDYGVKIQGSLPQSRRYTNTGKNKRSVWHYGPASFSEAHFATFPEDLISDCIKAGCPEGGIVLDPFMGAGTTAVVAKKLNRNYIGFELNPDYIKIAEKRLFNAMGLFNDVA